MSRLKHARAHALHAAVQRDVPVTVAIRDKALHITADSPGDAWMITPIVCADPLTSDLTGTVLSGLSRLNAVPVHVTVAERNPRHGHGDPDGPARRARRRPHSGADRSRA